MIEFRALGALAVLVDGEEVAIGGPRQRRLLAMLLVHHDDVVSADRLADAVFDGEPTDAARTTLRSYIARTRRVIGAASSDVGLITQAPGYSMRTAPGTFDAVCFEQRLEEGRRQLTTGDPALAVVTLQSALKMWAGPAYAEFADEEWAQPEAQRLEELRLAALERLVDAELECGRAADTIPTLDTLVKDHPLREAFRAQQMLALYRAGRQVDALRAFRSYRETLIEEIGLEPSPGLVELQRRILDHDPGLELTAAAGEPLRGYRLGRRLGAGPNGTMYIATVAGVNHERTISILADPRVDDPEFVRSFEANAQLIASLTHEAIVPLHDYWRQPGTAYVVTQRSSTSTLRDRLERGPVDRNAIVDIAVRIGGALLEAAAHGLEHGWITLDNIVGDDGRFAIGNFVICPRNRGHDVADFAAVLKACLQRAQPPISGTVGDDLSSILDHPGEDLAAFIETFTTSLLADGDAVRAPAANPFKGLRAFDETDGDDFHGRGVLVRHLLERIATTCPGTGLTLVVGGSGSGKSSVVRAGVIPQVRRGALRTSGDWFVSMMLPGSAPFTELAEAIRRISVKEHANLSADIREGRRSLAEAVGDALPSGVRLLLVIDQFEELFTLTPESEQADFLALLADAISDDRGLVHVMATLRADFYDRPLESQRFGTLVGPATVVVPAMSPQELEAAIVRPVESCGATAEPALVAELVAAMNDQAAGLPALQFTLYELAERRPDRCLTLDDYRALGGIERAIASRAEALFRSLDEPGRAIVRTVFEQLVVIDVEAEPTGRRCASADLTAGDDVEAAQQMIERWTAARLLSGDHDPRTRLPTVQVAHEALLRSWPRLRQWIIEDRDLIIEAHRRREAAAEWVRVERDEGALYRGARLEAALELAEPDFERLPPIEQEFLTASATLRDREAIEARQRADRQQRANRRLRVQMGIIAAALVVAMAVGFLAIDQRGEARSRARCRRRCAPRCDRT